MKHETFMKMAFVLAEESKCCSINVGAMIVRDGRIIATGINGTTSGHVNCCDHAHKQNWLLESKFTNPIVFNDAHGGKHTVEIIPEGTTHIFQSNTKERFLFARCVGEVVWFWSVDHKNWYRVSTKFSIMQEIRKLYYTIKDAPPSDAKLNQDFRERHHEWSKINEIHAEQNAILFAAKHGISVRDGTMYVTHSPCPECVKNLSQVGIKEIYYSILYDKNPPNWESILKQSGIKVTQIEIEEKPCH